MYLFFVFLEFFWDLQCNYFYLCNSLAFDPLLSFFAKNNFDARLDLGLAVFCFLGGKE